MLLKDVAIHAIAVGTFSRGHRFVVALQMADHRRTGAALDAE
jgi:hypothetical protein